MNLRFKYLAATESDTKSTSDVKIQPIVRTQLPFLTLTDDFVTNNKIFEESVTIKKPSATPYYAIDDNGTEVTTDLKHVISFAHPIIGEQSFWYLDTIGNIITLNNMYSIKDGLFNNNSIPVVSSIYPNSFNKDNTNYDTLDMPVKDMNARISEPNELTDSFTLVVLATGGLISNTRIDKVKINKSDLDIYLNINYLSLIKTTFTALNLDKTKIPLYTITKYSTNRMYGRYVGVQDTDTIYIPIQ